MRWGAGCDHVRRRETTAAAVATLGGGRGVGAGAGAGCLECLQDVVRALSMGSCLTTTEQRPVEAELRKGEGGGGRRRLEEVPGRIAVNGRGNAACLFTRQGKKGTNQDAMVVWENFNGRSDTTFCGVFDGHGPHGHLVARKVRDTLPSKLCELMYSDHGDSPSSCSSGGAALEDAELSPPCSDHASGGGGGGGGGSPAAAADDQHGEDHHREFLEAAKESFVKAFRAMDRELRLHRSIDCICSGTTAVTLIKQGHDLIVGNVGDSRAVLGTRDQNGHLVAYQLTVDLKPNHPREMRRIKRCNGRVFAHPDERDVARLWLPNCNSPGLAMARAFGDFCLKDFGLISVPDLSHRRIHGRDEFIILATDGVWDVLSNQETVELVASCSGHSDAARAVVDAANKSWKFKYPTSKNDDCAAICLFLNDDDGDDHRVSVAGKGLGCSPNPPSRLGNQQLSSERVTLEESDYASDSNTSGYEGSLQGFTRLNTLMTLPKFGNTGMPEN